MKFTYYINHINTSKPLQFYQHLLHNNKYFWKSLTSIIKYDIVLTVTMHKSEAETNLNYIWDFDMNIIFFSKYEEGCD